MDPCDGGGGGQCLSPSDIGCAGEGVGLASSEGTSWRGDGSTNCEGGDCRRNKVHVYTGIECINQPYLTFPLRGSLSALSE